MFALTGSVFAAGRLSKALELKVQTWQSENVVACSTEKGYTELKTGATESAPSLNNKSTVADSAWNYTRRSHFLT